jgi:hypothetical protein
MLIRRIFIALIFVPFLCCKDSPKEIKTETKLERDSIVVSYPIFDRIEKVFNTHGGLAAWKRKRTLSFEIAESENPEKHTVDLYSRDEKIEMPDIAMGSEEGNIWLLDKNNAYKGDATFYHNLMFYFYAMPFVFADNGLMFSHTEPLEFEGKSYPGIQIGFADGVGFSPKDEYFIHYNPETHQMEWLGYTVTYRTGEKSDNVKWIRYDDWREVDDIVLPKSITWFEYEGQTFKGPRNTVNFENVTLSETSQPDSFFDKPDGAKIVERKK